MRNLEKSGTRVNMSWENLIKQSQTFTFETEVEYINLQTRLESGNVTVKWQFSFEQRTEHMDNVQIEVIDIIGANLSDSEIKMIDNDGLYLSGKVHPHELVKYIDGDIRLEWK